MGMAGRVVRLATFFVGGLASCSVLLKGNSVQCEQTADCTARGGRFATSVCSAGVCEPANVDTGPLGNTVFSCLDQDAGDSGLLLTYNVKVVFYDLAATRSGRGTVSAGNFTYAPIAGMVVKTCTPFDAPCGSPEATLTTDAAGVVTVSIHQTSPIYLDAEDPAYLPTLFFPPTYVRSMDQEFLVGLLAPDQFVAAGQAANVDMSRAVGPDASVGNIVAASFDCQRNPAANVSWTIDDPTGSTRAYVVGGLISTAATVTSSEGYALFYNARVRSTQVQAFYGDSGVGLLSQNVLVRQGTQTVIYTWP
jgi:hypothetical protein